MQRRNHHAAHTAFYYRWKRTNEDWRRFATGVSLHGHTWHSRESLAFLPNAVKKLYILPRILHWAENRYYKQWRRSFDYSLGYWTSPVAPEAAYRLESHQIVTEGLHPLVSITDHDSVNAHEKLMADGLPASAVPLSLEWTAPYNSAIFHIGVHNLPPDAKTGLVDELKAYTHHPTPEKLASILSNLHDLPDTLVILNHPLSDQGRIGFEIHVTVVREFLQKYGQHIHALEVNSMQSWDINRRVAAIARDRDFPIVAGGDRHGFEPNGAINLTDTQTFSDYVHEIRHDHRSTVLFMPQAKRSLNLRYAENIRAIMEDYPELPGREFWEDRVFYHCPDGVTRSIAEMSGNDMTAFEAMEVALGALGMVNLLIRPLTPIFSESRKEI